MSPVARCHQPTLLWGGRETPSHEPPVPRVSPSTTLSFEGMGDASTGYFGTAALVEVGRAAAAFLPAASRCRSPSLSPLATRCLPPVGTGVAAGEGRAMSKVAPEQLWRANQPGAQGLAAAGCPAPLQRAAGAGEQALTPGLAIPQWLGVRSLLPGQHVRQKIDFCLQAGNRRPPCAGREQASDGHPGMRLRAQPRGRTRCPPQEGAYIPARATAGGWESSPTLTQPPQHSSGPKAQIRDPHVSSLLFAPQTLEAARSNSGRGCPCARARGSCRAPREQAGCQHPLPRSCPIRRPRARGDASWPRRDTPQRCCRVQGAALAGRIADLLRAARPFQEQAGDTWMLAVTPNCPVRPRGAGAALEQGSSGAVQGLVGALLPAGRPVSAPHPAGRCPSGGRGAPCSEDDQVSPGAGWVFQRWLPQPVPQHSARRGPTKGQGALWHGGTGRIPPPPQPGGAHPGGDGAEQEGTQHPQARRAESGSAAHPSAFNRIKLNFKGRRRPCPHPGSLCPQRCCIQAVPSGKPWRVNQDTQRRGGTAACFPDNSRLQTITAPLESALAPNVWK